MEFDDALAQLQAGGSFDEFAKKTTRVWESIARYLLRRWECPVAVSIEDVTQELLLNAWLRYKKFDPNRGVTLKRFLIFNATEYAKKWVHVQRNAYRRLDTSESRFATPNTELIEAIAPSIDTEAVLGFLITLDLKSRRMLKLKRTVGRLLDSSFDEKKAIDLLVSDGNSRFQAKRMVSKAIQEMRASW